MWTDIIVHYAYSCINSIYTLFEVYKAFVLGQFPLSFEMMSIGNILTGAVNVYAAHVGKPPLYWLHSLVLVVVTGCGGGILANPLIGKPAGILSNDLYVPIAIVTWYSTHYLGLQSFFQVIPVKLIWITFTALFKTKTGCDMVNLAVTALSPSKYYNIPITGPIITGTITGCGGLFLPFDKGLTPIFNGTPWALQSAFLTAFFYHTIVNDKDGIIGATMRSIFGTYSDSEMRAIIATVQIVASWLHVVFNYEANLFTPFHKLAYLFFQVEGPVGSNSKKSETDTVGWDYRTRVFLDNALEFSRIIAVFAVALGHVYFTLPQSTLVPGNFLSMNDTLGTCQVFSSVQKCQPFIFTMRPEFSSNSASFTLSTHKGRGKSISNLGDSSIPAWSIIAKPSKSKLTLDSSYGVVLGEDGVLRLISRSLNDKEDVLLWSSNSKCPSESISNESSNMIYMNIDQSGQPIIHCSDGSIVPLI